MTEIYGYVLITTLSENRYKLDLFDETKTHIREFILNSEYDAIQQANCFFGCSNWRYLN